MSKDSAEILEKLDHLTDLVMAEFKAQGERIARMEGRLDEQSRILAAMITTTLATAPQPTKPLRPQPNDIGLESCGWTPIPQRLQ